MSTKSPVAHAPSASPASTRRRVSAKTVAQKKGAKEVIQEAPLETETPPAEAQATRKVDGLRLIREIRKALIERDLPDRHISDIMGITPMYWHSLTNGHRTIKSLGKEKFKLIAEFLGIPVIQAYIMADYFSAEDFLNTKSLDEQLWLVIEKMQKDKHWMAYAPTREEWERMPVKVRAGYATLYEREYGRTLTQKAKLEVPELAR